MPDPLTIAIVGRPNVGKSTLFNRLLGRRLAIVSETPGTTRDRIIATATWEGTPYLLVDTGGLTLTAEAPLEKKVHAQAQEAIDQADLVLFMVDAAEGLTPVDQDVAQLLRRGNKPLILIANKCETPHQTMAVQEFHRLGLGDPLPLSALYNRGVRDLKQRVLTLLPPSPALPEEEEPRLKLAILGRPNVGKSSILNSLLGTERAIVTAEPGTTRDTLDTPLTYKEENVLLIDTAGIRRRGQVRPGIEKFSLLRAFQAIERCDVALLVLDAQELVAAQDAHIAGYAFDAFKSIIIAINKWDLAQQAGADAPALTAEVRRSLNFIPYAPIRFTCALTGEGVTVLLETAVEVYRERVKRIPQPELGRVLWEALAAHPPPTARHNSFNVYKIRQPTNNPPTFLLEVDRPDRVHFSYQRYLENALRSAYGYKGTHLKLLFQAARPPRGKKVTKKHQRR